MNRRYYLNNVIWGVIGFCVFGYIWIFRSDVSGWPLMGLILAALLSAILFPLAKKAVEDVALAYTEKKFWSTGFFVESPGKNGLYALFYLSCFVLSVPLAIVFICFFCKKKH